VQKVVIENSYWLVEVSSRKKISLGSADFLHRGIGYIEIAVFVPCQFQSRFQYDFLHSVTALLFIVLVVGYELLLPLGLLVE